MTLTTAAGTTTLFGVIVEGIRSTCRVLDTGHRRYALVSAGDGVGVGVDALREGDRVRVVGEPRDELSSPCGPAFGVRSLELL